MLKNKNFAKSLLAVELDVTDLSATVSTGEGVLFPAIGSFMSVIWGAAYSSPLLDTNREIIEMSLDADDTFTVIRAQEDTSIRNWAVDDQIAHILTAGKLDEIEAVLETSSGLYGDLISKTISGGAIDLTDTQHFVALTGEGDTTDALTAITKTGGGNLKVGFVVLLTGKTGLAYTITLADAGNLKLQRVFNMDNEYDSIPLIHRGGGIFQEMAGRVSNG